MEERDFFPAAVRVLQPQEWAEIASKLTDRKDPLFSETVEEGFEAVRGYIWELEQEAEAERACVTHPLPASGSAAHRR